MAEQRWKAIDLYKGILIILVVAGHIIPDNINENLVRYMIYSYHMPLFIGISGFLIDIRKWEELSIIRLVKKYWKRAVLPWLLAVSLYLLWDVIDLFVCVDNVHWKTVMKLVLSRYLHPPYHLWFVMGWISYIILSYLLFRIIRNRRIYICVYLVLALAISLVSYRDIFDGLVWEVL